MGCSSTSGKKRPNYKSCVRYYNNIDQPFTINSTNQLVLAGSRVVDTGVSIDTQPSSYTILTKGLYHLSADIVVNATVAGDLDLSFYMDGVKLPCTYTQNTLRLGYNSIHTETDLDIDSCCCNVSKNITLVITTYAAATGDVVHVCSGITKIA